MASKVQDRSMLVLTMGLDVPYVAKLEPLVVRVRACPQVVHHHHHGSAVLHFAEDTEVDPSTVVSEDALKMHCFCRHVPVWQRGGPCPVPCLLGVICDEQLVPVHFGRHSSHLLVRLDGPLHDPRSFGLPALLRTQSLALIVAALRCSVPLLG